MAENYTLYISNSELITNARIRQAAEGAKVHFFAEDEGHTEHANWVSFNIRWPEGVARIGRMDRRDPELPDHLREIAAFVNGAAAAAKWMAALRASVRSMQRRATCWRCPRLRSARSVWMRLPAASPPNRTRCSSANPRFGTRRAVSAWMMREISIRRPPGRSLPSALERKARSEAAASKPRHSGSGVAAAYRGGRGEPVRPPWEVARRAPHS